MKNAKYLLWGLIVALMLTAFAPLAIPTRPVLVSPINKVVKVDPDAVTLKWSKSTATRTFTISDYDVEVSDSSALQADGSFVSTVDTGNVVSPAVEYLVTAGQLDYGRTYYWHVRANDSVPSTSAWSATGIFRVGVEPPTAVAFVPADLLTLRPTFSWTPGAQNAASYTIQISRDSGFSTIYRTATVLYSALPANQYTPTTDLMPNVLFHWRVRANNSTLGNSDWSASESFTSANPPSIPVLVSPKGVKVSITPTLTWKVVSLQAGETFETYEVEIFDTNVDVNNKVPVFTANNTLNDAIAPDPSLADQDGNTGGTTTYYDVPDTAGLFPATTYYWRIKAYNGDGEYSTSSLSTFYTSIVGEVDSASMDPGEDLGNVPGLEDPTAGTTKTIPGFTGTVGENANLLSLYPIFKWDPGALNAETFTLQIAAYASGSCNVAEPEKSTFASQIVNVSLPFSDAEYAANLSKYPNYVLCWRVRGNHSLYGSSSWSDVQIFKTANPPGIPEPIAPVDGILTNDNSPRFVWKQVTLPSGTVFGKYEVEISYNSNFSGYDYPDDTIPPYGGDVDPASYPLPYPILPGNVVADPVYSVVPPQVAFPKIPMIQQAYDTYVASATFGEANTVSEPWFNVPQDIVAGPPVGDPLYGAHTYYWRVRSYNSAGEYSAWSKSRSIMITVDRPTNLVITDCAGTVLTDALTPRPCFDWDDVYKANRYLVTIWVGSQKIVNTWVSGSYYQPRVDLPKGKEIKWRVQASDFYRYKTGVPSETQSFMSANPPTTPKPISPIGNKLVVPTALEPDPVFRWARSLYPLGTNFDYYEIEIAQDPNFAFLVEPAAQTTSGDEYELSYTIAPGVLTPARKYYWHVRACNDEAPAECSTWSPTNSFRTAVEAPTLVSTPPVPDGLDPLILNFEWNSVNDAASYTIRISKGPACDVSVAGATVNAFTLTYRRKLAAATTYYWCVRANNATYGPGPWSAIDTFSTP